jgi:hypothetical protein
MRTITLTIGLLGLILLSSCDRENVTAPVSDLALAGNSGCSTVKFTTVLTPTGPVSFSGVLTGDLEGTVDQVFDEFGSFTGVTIQVAADATWHITGGIIPELIGETFVTRLTNRNVFLPGTSLTKNIGSLRAQSGVERANLTYIGQTQLTTSETTLNFVGVICTHPR